MSVEYLTCFITDLGNVVTDIYLTDNQRRRCTPNAEAYSTLEQLGKANWIMCSCVRTDDNAHDRSFCRFYRVEDERPEIEILPVNVSDKDPDKLKDFCEDGWKPGPIIEIKKGHSLMVMWRNRAIFRGL